MSWTESEISQIQASIERLLASSAFKSAVRSQRFLQYVTTETLAGRADKLKGYVIGVEVFDKNASSFDPGVDAIVRVEATRLRAKLREYYENEGHEEPIRIDLPKGSYQVHIRWVDSSLSIHDVRTLVAVKDKPSLVVLPFSNMSSDAEQEYFADGFTDCLITELSHISGLLVISRQSAFVYKNQHKRAEIIGQELGVEYLLEGSIQRAGQRIRINAQLINTVSGEHIWAERYDRELQDIFALQDDVIRHIVSALQVKLPCKSTESIVHEGTRSVEAHDAFLRGLEYFWGYNPATTEKAKHHFEACISLDPYYAEAHAWLARSLVFQWVFLWDPQDETLECALTHARTAIALASRSSNAHAVYAWVQCWRREGEDALAAARHAVALDSNNADAHMFLGMILMAMNRADEALQVMEICIRLNPHPSTFNIGALGFCYFTLGRLDEALATFQRGVQINDAFIPNHAWTCMILTMQGKTAEAAIAKQKVLALAQGRRPVVRTIWLDATLRQSLGKLFEEIGFA